MPRWVWTCASAHRKLLAFGRIIALAEELAAVSGAHITITEDPNEAVAGVDFIHTDIWVSMGEPAEVWAERIALLKPYQSMLP